MKLSRKEKIKKAGYTALQWTWGLPQTAAGAALYLKHRNDEHFSYRGATATVWNSDRGVSLGKFIFVPAKSSEFLIDHEYHGTDCLTLRTRERRQGDPIILRCSKERQTSLEPGGEEGKISTERQNDRSRVQQAIIRGSREASSFGAV